MSQRLAKFLHDRHPERESNALRALQEAARRTGAPASREVIERIAAEHGLPVAWVHGVATFYEDIVPRPRGKAWIQCCQGTACLVDGSEKAERRLLEQLEVGEAEVTPDGALSVEKVYCLGRCHASPSALIHVDGRDVVIDHLDRIDPAQLVASIRDGSLQPAPQEVIVESHAEPTILLRRMDRGASATDLATARAGGAYAGLQKALTLQ
ncbi:MAG TPA: NAD(P)H-dependent oxidoreductase subunit E, partial [bacterium]|nr:NAD(P)H-dependent oxidoreductase subunit E [bacterium]